MLPTILLLSIVGVSAIVAMVSAVRHAPEGYEDHEGFHFGRESVTLNNLSHSSTHAVELDRHAA